MKIFHPIKYLVFIVQSDVYEKHAKSRVESPPILRFVLGRISIEALWKKTKNSVYSHILHIASTNIHRIANRRLGGNCTHKFVFFSYTSFLGAVNTQIHNWAKSFHGVPRLPEIRLACIYDSHERIVSHPTHSIPSPHSYCSTIANSSRNLIISSILYPTS